MGWVGDITRQVLPKVVQKSELSAPAQEVLAAQQALGGDRLALSGVARTAQQRPLDANALRNLDDQVNQLAGLSTDAQQKLHDRYAPVFADPELQAKAEKALSGWVWGGKGKEALQEAYSHVIAGKSEPSGDLETLVSQLAETRSARWQRLATREGLPMPAAFHVFRGVRGQYAVDEVLKSWMDDKTDVVGISHNVLSSWSTDPTIAGKFAEGADAAAVYKADIPFAQTFMDKWGDGGPLVTLGYDQNEVVVGAPRDSLTIPKQDVTVTYQGRTYGYAERQALMAAWAKDHPAAA